MDRSYMNEEIFQEDEFSKMDFSKVVDQNIFNSLVATGVLRGKDLAYFCSTNSKAREWCDNQFYKEAYLRDFKSMPGSMPIEGEPDWREEYIERYLPFYVSLSNEKQRKIYRKYDFESDTLIAENMIPGPGRKGLSLFLNSRGRMRDEMEGEYWWDFNFENSKDFQCCTDPSFNSYIIAILDKDSKIWATKGTKKSMVNHDDVNFRLYNPLGYIPTSYSNNSSKMYYKSFHVFYYQDFLGRYFEFIFTTTKNELYCKNRRILKNEYVMDYTRPIHDDNNPGVVKFYVLTTAKNLIMASMIRNKSEGLGEHVMSRFKDKVNAISQSFRGAIFASTEKGIVVCDGDKMELVEEIKVNFNVTKMHLSQNYLVISGKEPFQYKVYDISIKWSGWNSDRFEMYKINEDVTEYFKKAGYGHVDGIKMYLDNRFELFKVRIV